MFKCKFLARCNYRLAAGFVLLMSAVVYGNYPVTAGNSGPRRVQTLSGAMSDCASRGVNTVVGHLGCSNSRGGSVRILRIKK